MKRNVLTCIVMFLFSCAAYSQQTTYAQPPYDGQEAWLREISKEEMSLGPLVINQDWVKRDPQTYLRFKDEQQTILLYGTDSIPEWITEFKELKFLCSMPSAKVKSIPENIGQLNKLENLVLLESNISYIPTSFKDLTNLKQLNLVGNGKCVFPNYVNQLDSIETLFLANFKNIPNAVFELITLKRLYLYKNNIEIVPESIITLKELEELNLEGNVIKQIPDAVFELPKLSVISVDKSNLISNSELKEKLDRDLQGNKGLQKNRLRYLQDIERKKIFKKMKAQEEEKMRLRKHIKAYYAEGKEESTENSEE